MTNGYSKRDKRQSVKGPIVIIAEHENGHIRPVTWELAAFAKKIASSKSVEVRAMLVGDRVDGCARRLSEKAGVPVTTVCNPRLKDYDVELYRHALREALNALSPALICLAHTTRGAELAPVMAFDLSAACISGVEDVRFQEEGIRFFRSIFGGKIQAAVTPLKDRAVLTLQPGSFRPDDVTATSDARVFVHEAVLPDDEQAALSVRPARTQGVDLSEARVLVAAGRGIGEEENLAMVRKLASMFPRAAVCGSRPIVDAGWMDYNRQVGVTGATVSPALYLACGISGALQHVSGMRASGFVVAVNSDPCAAIFNDSDVCVVEDLNEFIPVFIEAANG